jgi:hypothetical protein
MGKKVIFLKLDEKKEQDIEDRTPLDLTNK